MSDRPYTRCQVCGTKHLAVRSSPLCGECQDGQAYFWPTPNAPPEFAPLPVEKP